MIGFESRRYLNSAQYCQNANASVAEDSMVKMSITDLLYAAEYLEQAERSKGNL